MSGFSVSASDKHPPASPAGAAVAEQGWTQRYIDIAPKAPLEVRFYGRRVARPSPLVLHFHAGAFVGGSLDTGSAVARLLADAGAVVMSIDYPLAPAHPFPQALQAGYAALLWAWKARHKLAGKDAPLFVAGEEAGGNLAAAVALMSRDQQAPALAGQILLSPMLDPCMGTASLRCADAGQVGCTWADGWHTYLSQLENASHPYAAPGKVTRLTGVPPTLLLTAQDDPLRDEAIAYAERLRQAGQVVHGCVLPGPTGWPASYLQPAGLPTGQPADWAGPVRQQFERFFADLPADDNFDAAPLLACKTRLQRIQAGPAEPG